MFTNMPRQRDAADPCRSSPRVRSGFLLVELLLVMAALALLATTLASAALSLRRCAQPQLAAAILVDALREARLRAYRSGQAATVLAQPGAGKLRLLAGGGLALDRPLGPGVVVRKATRAGRGRFYPSGLADNVSWTLALAGAPADSGVRVVVNQRGMIHWR